MWWWGGECVLNQTKFKEKGSVLNMMKRCVCVSLWCIITCVFKMSSEEGGYEREMGIAGNILKEDVIGC